MRVPILLPELGDAAAKFSLWTVRPGDEVREGDRIAEITIPGLLMDVVAPVTGLLAERFVSAGQSLAVRQVLGLIETGTTTS